MNLVRLSKTPRPSSTAASMEAKSSSVRTMSAGSLATSVPLRPIATPMSARLSAGASLTPSPVMAITCPRRWRAWTSLSFCSGETRAKTVVRSAASASSVSGQSSRSVPVMTGPSRPVRAAIARAVAAWSPVIILTWMPASRQARTAAAEAARGGSYMPWRPRKMRGGSSPSARIEVAAGTLARANASTRRPSCPSRSASSIAVVRSSISAWPSAFSWAVHNSRTRSTEPLT
jgi:hypothetical protein